MPRDYEEILGKKDSDYFFNTLTELKKLNLPTYTPMFLASWNISKQNHIRISAVNSVPWNFLKNLQFKVAAKKQYFIMLLPAGEDYFVGNSKEFDCLKPEINRFFKEKGYKESKEQSNLEIADLFVGIPDKIRTTDKKTFVELLNLILNNAKEIKENIN
jgi:hypothetical protein